MLFNSYIFLFIFLPVCLLGFFTINRFSSFGTKLFLIGMSLWFYGYFNPYYLLVIIGSVLLNYITGQVITRGDKYRKAALIVGIILNLSVLFYFKYFDFFIGSVNAVFGTSFLLKNIVLPLGISFFTFQQISFLHDIYAKKIDKVSFVDYALFVTFFPQLIAGPIVTASDMLPQFANLKDNRFNADSFINGIVIFVLGLGKKVILADTFGRAVDIIYGSSDNILKASSTDALLVILFYTIQLYFDFSGYCDMAIGIGKMMNIEIAVNFNSPYKATNILDFWKRWHITLSRFFTQNIYIPLGGNRKGAVRMYINLFLIFFLSGIWHGAGYTFILWGCMHGVLYVITRFIEIKRNKKPLMPKGLGIFLTFIFVNIAWVFFRADSIADGAILIANVFKGNFMMPREDIMNAFMLPEIKVFFNNALPQISYMIAFLAAALLIIFFAPNVHEIAKSKLKVNAVSGIAIGIIYVWCILSISDISTFLYFNF